MDEVEEWKFPDQEGTNGGEIRSLAELDESRSPTREEKRRPTAVDPLEEKPGSTKGKGKNRKKGELDSRKDSSTDVDVLQEAAAVLESAPKKAATLTEEPEPVEEQPEHTGRPLQPWGVSNHPMQAVGVRQAATNAVYVRGNRRTVGNVVQVVRNFVSGPLLEQQKILVQLFVALMLCLGLFFALVEDSFCFQVCEETDIEINKGQFCYLPDESPPSCTYEMQKVTKSLVSLTTAAALAGLYFEYTLQARLLALKHHVQHFRSLTDTSLKKQGLVPYLVFECLVFGLHCPPFVTFKINVEFKGLVAVYRAEAILACVMSIRLYYLWRVYKDYMFLGHMSRRFASLIYSTDVGSLFTLKATMASSAFWIVAIFFGGFTLITSYYVRVSEGPVQTDLPVYFWNCCWFVVVTMTSVGYGDATTITHVGRMAAVVAMIVGAVVSGILTSAVYLTFSFTANEYSTMHFLNAHLWEKKKLHKAATVVQRNWRFGSLSPFTRKAFREMESHRRLFLNWQNSEPHFGKLMQDAVVTTSGVSARIHALDRTIQDLLATEEKRLAYCQQIKKLKELQAREENGNESDEEEKEEEINQDLPLLLGELEQQRRLLEQLLRSIIFLTSSRAQDVQSLEDLLKQVGGTSEQYQAKRKRLHEKYAAAHAKSGRAKMVFT